MKLTFLGTKGEIEEESRTHKNHASLLIESDGFKLLVDFGETYSQKYFEELEPDAVIVTHAHDDHISGLKGFPIEVPVYLHEGIRESRYYRREDYLFMKERSYSPYRSFSVGPFRILAVPVLHSLYAPNVALFIESEDFKLCYASDVLSISTEDREKYLVDCDLYIGDGSTLSRDLVRRKDDDPYGHKSIRGQLAWLRDAGVKDAIFTHFGKEAVLLGDEELKRRFSKWQEEFVLASLEVAMDGKSFRFEKERRGGAQERSLSLEKEVPMSHFLVQAEAENKELLLDEQVLRNISQDFLRELGTRTFAIETVYFEERIPQVTFTFGESHLVLASYPEYDTLVCDCVICFDERKERLEGILKETLSRAGFRPMVEKAWGFFRTFGSLYPFRKLLLSLIPQHKIYVEVFCGAGELIWAKKPSLEEFLCDIDSDIVRLHKICKRLKTKEIAWLEKQNWVGDKALFYKLREQLKKGIENDLEFFYAQLYLRHFSRQSAPPSKDSFRSIFQGKKAELLPRILESRERLKKVKIRRLDFRESFRIFDSKKTFFFCDPPYPGRKQFQFGMEEDDYLELGSLMRSCQGNALLVIEPTADLRRSLKEMGLVEKRFHWPAGFKRFGWRGQRRNFRVASLFSNYELEKAEFLPVRPSGEKRDPRKTWQEVASYFNKPFKIVDGFVKLTGGVVNWPEGTEGDFDILICTIPEKDLFKRTEFRLGRGAPPEIAERLDIRQKEEVGVSPFTNYVVLGDLVFVPREKLEVVEMSGELLEADAEKEAELSLKQDKIKPLRHFYPLKPLRGAKPATKQTIDSLLELLTLDLFPFFVSPKRDGARHLLHRDGKEVKIISDDGTDNTDKLPKLKERLLKVPHKSFVLDTEIELWKEGQHYPREAAAGAIHSGKEEGLIINVFDILYLDGKDLHKLPQEERLRILREFPVDQEAEEVPKPGKLLNRVQHKLAKDKESLRKLIEYFSYLPGSEGVVIKRAVSPYPLTGEPGRTKCWWKFHKSIDAVVTVVRRNETKTKGVYVYDYGIEAKKRKGLLPHPTEQVKGKTVHLIGRTFMTNEFMNPGERFWVEADIVNLIENLDDRSWRLTIWVPTFLKKTDRSEHSPEEIIRSAKSENIFQWKVIKDGETIYHPKEPIKKIKDIHTYDPRKVSDQVLQDDWRIVAAWFAGLKEGKKLKYREEEVVWLASKILKEIFRRGKVTFGLVR